MLSFESIAIAYRESLVKIEREMEVNKLLAWYKEYSQFLKFLSCQRKWNDTLIKRLTCKLTIGIYEYVKIFDDAWNKGERNNIKG